MPKFLLKFNAAIIKEIAMDKEQITVGRRPDNDLVIDNPAVSGHHCRIYSQAGSFFVEDLNSTNGTFVNEKKIIRAGLRHNDVIGIVKHALVFVEETAPQNQSTNNSNAAAPAPPSAAAVAVSAEQAKPAAKAAPPAAVSKEETVGFLQVVDGLVDKPEYELNALSTYVGKSNRVQIPIKGLFAPEMAAMIARRPEGYYIVAMKAGYPKVNGNAVQEKQSLQEGDQIEIGGTRFRFTFKK